MSRLILLTVTVLITLTFSACETARPGGPATSYKAQRDQIIYVVPAGHGQTHASFAKSGVMPLDEYHARIDRRIVFRGAKIQSVPAELREAIIALESLYCATMRERAEVTALKTSVGVEAQTAYLNKISPKVRESSYQRYRQVASTYTGVAYITEAADALANAKSAQLLARANDALAQQTRAVNLLAKHGVEVYRVFDTFDGMKQLRLPQ